MQTTKPWYQSKTVWGAALVILPVILSKFGFQTSTEELDPILHTLATDVREVIGSALVVWGTICRSRRPLSLK